MGNVWLCEVSRDPLSSALRGLVFRRNIDRVQTVPEPATIAYVRTLTILEAQHTR